MARARKSACRSLADGKPMRFLFLPDGDDPDSFVRKHGKEAFEQLVREAQTAVAVPARRAARRSRPRHAEGRAAVPDAAKPHIAEDHRAGAAAAAHQARSPQLARVSRRTSSSALLGSAARGRAFSRAGARRGRSYAAPRSAANGRCSALRAAGPVARPSTSTRARSTPEPAGIAGSADLARRLAGELDGASRRHARCSSSASGPALQLEIAAARPVRSCEWTVRTAMSRRRRTRVHRSSSASSQICAAPATTASCDELRARRKSHGGKTSWLSTKSKSGVPRDCKLGTSQRALERSHDNATVSYNSAVIQRSLTEGWMAMARRRK